MSTTLRISLASCALLLPAAPTVLAAPPTMVAADSADADHCRGTFTVFHPRPPACLEPIETDRPHRTDTPNTVDAGHWQVELGILELAMPSLSKASNATAGVLVNGYKLGLANELGFLHGWDIEILHQVASHSFEQGALTWSSSILVRTKLKLTEGPVATTLVPVVIIPVHSEDRLEGGGFVFFGGELPGALDFELNLGGLTETDPDAGKRSVIGVVTTAVTRDLVGPLSAFVELYNDRTLRSGTSWNTSVDSGLILLLGRDVQLDFGAYVGVAGELPAVTPFLGLSGRL